ncbi:MAG: hypothetical protein ACFFCS_00695 [Candidatus Hodarchaeota archaeon]
MRRIQLKEFSIYEVSAKERIWLKEFFDYLSESPLDKNKFSGKSKDWVNPKLEIIVFGRIFIPKNFREQEIFKIVFKRFQNDVRIDEQFCIYEDTDFHYDFFHIDVFPWLIREFFDSEISKTFRKKAKMILEKAINEENPDYIAYSHDKSSKLVLGKFIDNCLPNDGIINKFLLILYLHFENTIKGGFLSRIDIKDIAVLKNEWENKTLVVGVITPDAYNFLEDEDYLMEDYSIPYFRDEYEIEEGFVFMLMPFDLKLTQVYNDYIKQPLEEMGLKVERADDIYTPSHIMADIWMQINKAEIVIAELTGRNPNVFYELGIAHSLRKYTILITQDLEDVPFDLTSLRIIDYKYEPDGFKELTEKIKVYIKTKRQE